MIIGIDFDDTIFATNKAVIDLYNRRHHGEILSVDDIVNYNFYDCFEEGVTKELIEMFDDVELYQTLKPVDGAIDGVKSLVNAGHEIYIVTATNIKNLRFKESLLKKHFPFIPSRNLIRMCNKKLFKGDVLVDDSLDNFVGNLCDKICLNQPYNQDTSKDFVYGIRRANDWEEIVKIINDIEKEQAKWAIE